MEGWVILGLILIAAAYFLGRVGFAVEADKEKSAYSKMNEAIDKAVNAEDFDTITLVMATLRKMGCSPQIEDDGEICFSYQGWVFYIEAVSNKKVIYIRDYWILKAEMIELQTIQEAVNSANIASYVGYVYQIDKENSIIGVHCMLGMLFMNQMPDLDGLLTETLGHFFRSRRNIFEKRLEELRRNNFALN